MQSVMISRWPRKSVSLQVLKVSPGDRSALGLPPSVTAGRWKMAAIRHSSASSILWMPRPSPLSGHDDQPGVIVVRSPGGAFVGSSPLGGGRAIPVDYPAARAGADASTPRGPFPRDRARDRLPWPGEAVGAAAAFPFEHTRLLPPAGPGEFSQPLPSRHASFDGGDGCSIASERDY